MEKRRTYKSKRGGVYELVQVKAPEKKKRRRSGKVKADKNGLVRVPLGSGVSVTYGSREEYEEKTAPKAAKPKKASKAQKMAGKARAVKRARKTTSKRKPGQLNLL